MLAHRRATFPLIVTTAVVLAACVPSPSTADAERAIAALRDSLQAAENTANAEAMAATLDDDVIFMPPDGPDIRGKATVSAFLQGLFENVSMAVHYESQEVVIAGDWAFDRGVATSAATVRASGAVTEAHHRYLWVLHRDANGEWKYARITWNSDVAPPEAP